MTVHALTITQSLLMNAASYPSRQWNSHQAPAERYSARNAYLDAEGTPRRTARARGRCDFRPQR
jgi:hypothetical protein